MCSQMCLELTGKNWTSLVSPAAAVRGLFLANRLVLSRHSGIVGES